MQHEHGGDPHSDGSPHSIQDRIRSLSQEHRPRSVTCSQFLWRQEYSIGRSAGRSGPKCPRSWCHSPPSSSPSTQCRSGGPAS